MPVQQHRQWQLAEVSVQVKCVVTPATVVSRHTVQSQEGEPICAAAGMVRLWTTGVAHTTVPATTALRLISWRREMPRSALTSSGDTGLQPLQGSRDMSHISKVPIKGLYGGRMNRSPHRGVFLCQKIRGHLLHMRYRPIEWEH